MVVLALEVENGVDQMLEHARSREGALLGDVAHQERREPAADLAIVVAAASSYMERPLPADVVVLGEVGLTGEVRAVAGLESRLRAAAQLGFRSAVVPKSSAAEAGAAPLKVRGVATVTEAVEALLP